MNCQEQCPNGEGNICCHGCSKENSCIDSCTNVSVACKNSICDNVGDAESVIARINFNLEHNSPMLVDEKLAHKILGMLRELETLRKVKVRPATKFLSNPIPVQMMKIEEEFREVLEGIQGDVVINKHNTLQELMDMQGACETMVHIIEPNREARIIEKMQHFDKDNNRGYYN